jgi:hypothetical protein
VGKIAVFLLLIIALPPIRLNIGGFGGINYLISLTHVRILSLVLMLVSQLVAGVEKRAEARTVVGSYLGSAVPARDIPLYVDLWRSGRLPLERLVSSRITLHDLDVAMDRLAAGGELRQLIVLDERTPL